MKVSPLSGDLPLGGDDQAGYPDFETLAWWGIFAPKDTPSGVIASMTTA
jgi:hypothetical protein